MWTEWSRSFFGVAAFVRLASAGLVPASTPASVGNFSNNEKDGNGSSVESWVSNCSLGASLPASDQHGWPWSDPGTLIGSLLCVGYMFVVFGRVCEGYFVPCIKIICFKLGLPSDVAGATLMAAAVSSPDLFISLIGTFLTEGDIGTGTVFGCGVLNMLLIPPLCLFLSSSKVIRLDWWPVTRDCFIYGASILLLSFAMRDNLVSWHEALFLVMMYICYVIVLSYDRKLREFMHNTWYWLRSDPSSMPLLAKREAEMSYGIEEELTFLDELRQTGWTKVLKWPSCSGFLVKFWWILTRPIEVFLYLTIPDPVHTEMYLTTFITCLIWIAVSSYIVGWLMTVAGLIMHIPDSLMGLTLLAIGMGVPSVISSVIVAKQGHGGMAVANAIGSNTFDVLICLGLPWLLKTVQGQPMVVNSKALPISSLLLLSTLAVLYLALATTNFTITRQVGVVSLVMYGCFIVTTSFLEMSLIFQENLWSSTHDLRAQN